MKQVGLLFESFKINYDIWLHLLIPEKITFSKDYDKQYQFMRLVNLEVICHHNINNSSIMESWFAPKNDFLTNESLKC